MTDSVQDLPTDEIPPTMDEKDMIQWLFKEKSMKKETQKPENATKEFHVEIQGILFIFGTFLLFSNTYIQSLLLKVSPIKNDIFILVILGLCYAFLIYLYLNWSYSRN